MVELSDIPLDLGLTGHVAVVTGAAGGIGAAITRAFAQAGAHVYAIDRDEQALARLCDGLSNPAAHHFAAHDLAEVGSHERLVREIKRRAGALNSLTHAAAVLRRSTLQDVTEQDWDAQVEINMKATFFLSRAVGMAMLEQGGGGSITNFTSQGWWTGGFGGSIVYAATKGGVVSMSRGFARSFASGNVRVNTVAPGAADTAMMRQDQSDAELDEFVQTIPLGRMASPAEVAPVAVFLASEHARYITGATINVTGGQIVY